MNRQFFLAGLALALMFAGCKLHKEEPVAQQKNVGRILDEALKGKKLLQDVPTHISKVRSGVKAAMSGRLSVGRFKDMVDSVLMGGSKAITEFKLAPLRNVFDEYVAITQEMTHRLAGKMEALPPAVKNELNVSLARPDVNYTEAAAFLKKHTDIANDKIFARLVERLGHNLDEFAEAVATNHRLADAARAEFASANYDFKGLPYSPEQIVSEMKISSKDFSLEKIVLNTATDNPTDGYKYIQELSGVDVHDEAHVLDLLLRRGNDGKFAYESLSAAEIKKLGNPFDKKFIEPFPDPALWPDATKYMPEHLREFYKAD